MNRHWDRPFRASRATFGVGILPRVTHWSVGAGILDPRHHWIQFTNRWGTLQVRWWICIVAFAAFWLALGFALGIIIK